MKKKKMVPRTRDIRLRAARDNKKKAGRSQVDFDMEDEDDAELEPVSADPILEELEDLDDAEDIAALTEGKEEDEIK